MQDLIKQLEALVEAVQSAIRQLNIDSDREHAAGLEKRAQEPDFWSDPQAAGAVTKQLAELQRHIEAWDSLNRDAHETLELARLEAKSEHPDAGAAAEIRRLYDAAQLEFDRRQFELKLSGPHDR